MATLPTSAAAAATTDNSALFRTNLKKTVDGIQYTAIALVVSAVALNIFLGGLVGFSLRVPTIAAIFIGVELYLAADSYKKLDETQQAALKTALLSDGTVNPFVLLAPSPTNQHLAEFRKNNNISSLLIGRVYN